VGDAVCTTNPTLGRGLSLALWGAVDLVDGLSDHDGDPAALALALDDRVAAHLAPFYEDQAAIDGARLAILRHTIFGEPVPEPAVAPDRVTYAQLRTAAWYDPTAFRGFWNLMGMLRLPNEVYCDPQIVAATRDAIRRHGSAPPIQQPTRDQLLAALAA
jgi:hypothetical protein